MGRMKWVFVAMAAGLVFVAGSFPLATVDAQAKYEFANRAAVARAFSQHPNEAVILDEQVFEILGGQIGAQGAKDLQTTFEEKLCGLHAYQQLEKAKKALEAEDLPAGDKAAALRAIEDLMATQPYQPPDPEPTEPEEIEPK